MCKKSGKTDKAKIREILAPHLLQRGPSYISRISKIRGKTKNCLLSCTAAVKYRIRAAVLALHVVN
jgi:hypothetical protein